MAEQLVIPVTVAVEKEINGIEMGVLDDGTPFLSGRSLAELCGVVPSAVIKQATNWKNGIRTGRLAKMLMDTGYTKGSLYIETKHKGRDVYAYPDSVCMVFLEYYAFDIDPPSATAAKNYRILARSSLRAFIYTALGYDPAKKISESWKHYHDRIKLNNVPAGYFNVYGEISGVILAAIKGGLNVDHRVVPDISVGQVWSKHWVDAGLEKKHGARFHHPHFYPSDFPQSESNPQEMWVYPEEALPEFRKWLRGTYLPRKFPHYIQGKIKDGHIAPMNARTLLGQLAKATTPLSLSPMSSDDEDGADT